MLAFKNWLVIENTLWGENREIQGWGLACDQFCQVAADRMALSIKRMVGT